MSFFANAAVNRLNMHAAVQALADGTHPANGCTIITP